MIILLLADFKFAAYTQYMKENGGTIINIIADMFKGFPLMRYQYFIVEFYFYIWRKS